MTRIVVAGLAGLGAAAGAVLIGYSTGGRAMDGYVSEAGVATAPHSVAYRAGVLALAAGLVLLAAAATRASWTTAAVLALAAAATTVSAAVSCTEGCPLPPHEDASTADLVHGGASVLAVALFALALGVLALSRRASALRLAARIGFCLVTATGVTIAGLMLGVGRSTATALLERAILVTATVWTILLCVLLARRGKGSVPG